MDKVSLFGKQVLEAINFLHKQGFPCLGHVHTGNIYVVSPDHCKLGGYDNTLLGYRTRLYRMCEQHGYAKAIDVVMFGEWLGHGKGRGMGRGWGKGRGWGIGRGEGVGHGRGT